MELYRSDYLTINYEPELSLFCDIWSSKAAEMTDEDYNQEMEVWVRLVNEYKPTRLYDYVKESYSSINLDLTDWSNDIWSSDAFSTIKKYAIVVNNNYYSELYGDPSYSFEPQLPTRYFADNDAAIKWVTN